MLPGVEADVFPDGGLARVRLYGSMDPAQRRMIGLRWFNALPETHARAAIAQHAARRGEHATKLAASRPFTDAATLLAVCE
jgi:allantoicase